MNVVLCGDTVVLLPTLQRSESGLGDLLASVLEGSAVVKLFRDWTQWRWPACCMLDHPVRRSVGAVAAPYTCHRLPRCLRGVHLTIRFQAIQPISSPRMACTPLLGKATRGRSQPASLVCAE